MATAGSFPPSLVTVWWMANLRTVEYSGVQPMSEASAPHSALGITRGPVADDPGPAVTVGGITSLGVGVGGDGWMGWPGRGGGPPGSGGCICGLWLNAPPTLAAFTMMSGAPPESIATSR